MGDENQMFNLEHASNSFATQMKNTVGAQARSHTASRMRNFGGVVRRRGEAFNIYVSDEH